MTQVFDGVSFVEQLKKMGAEQHGVGRTEVMQPQLVDFFPKLFAQWLFKGDDLIVHVFPRRGLQDKYRDPVYDEKSYLPGRLETRARKVEFGPKTLDYIKDAASKVTFGDVELDFVQELGAWAVKFKDAKEHRSDWVGTEGCHLEVFLASLNQSLEG